MTQINRSRKDTLPHLVIWSAKNTRWWGKPVVRSFSWFGQMSEGCIVWWPSPLIPSISFSLCLPTATSSLLWFFHFLSLPDAPSITRHQQRCRIPLLQWENEIISSSISSSSSPTAANSCSSWCFFLKPQVPEWCDYTGISSSIENKMSLATKNSVQQKTNTNNKPPLDVGKRLLQFLNAWTWQYGPCPGSSYTQHHSVPGVVNKL